MKTITKNRFTHWYNEKGEACHTVTGKYGNEIKTTVVHARKMGFFPSVTSIIGLLHREQLENWKQDQLIRACMKINKTSEETDDQYINRVVEEAFTKSTTAIDFGKETHYFIQDLLQGKMRAEYSIPEITQNAIRNFVNKEIVHSICEKPLVHSVYKYAGQRDCRSVGRDGKSTTWDFKTQSTKVGEKIKSYDEWIMQIAAYDAVEPSDCYQSLIISSTEPERVEVMEYDKETIDAAFKAFLGLREVFKFIKGV